MHDRILKSGFQLLNAGFGGDRGESVKARWPGRTAVLIQILLEKRCHLQPSTQNQAVIPPGLLRKFCEYASLLVAWMVILSGIPSAKAGTLKQTAWVFPSAAPNPVTNSSARQTLIANSAASGIAHLYVSVYSSTPNSAGRLMYDETAIADLITRAHTNGMQVFAAYGAPDWPTFGCNANGFPLQRMAEVASYNSAHPSAKFDGVVLDVEPPEPQSTSDFQALLAQYACIRSTLPNDIGLSLAIRFFWDAVIEYPAGSNVLKPVYAHVIGMNVANVIVMGYRDFAGPSDCTTDGIICLDQDEIAYAAGAGKLQLVLAGVETIDPAVAGITNRETFFEEGQSILNSEARAIIGHFGPANGLGGLAIHNYQQSYLNGSVAWPAMNPLFPTNVIAMTSIRRISASTVRLQGVGVPNHSHTIEIALNPSGSSFAPLTHVTADDNGALTFDDTNATNVQTRFYRVAFP